MPVVAFSFLFVKITYTMGLKNPYFDNL